MLSAGRAHQKARELPLGRGSVYVFGARKAPFCTGQVNGVQQGTTSSACDGAAPIQPAATGLASANVNGEISFGFELESTAPRRRGSHVHLSGIAIAEAGAPQRSSGMAGGEHWQVASTGPRGPCHRTHSAGLPLADLEFRGGTCDDGEQNGFETSVDCGGSCPLCPHSEGEPLGLLPSLSSNRSDGHKPQPPRRGLAGFAGLGTSGKHGMVMFACTPAV